MILLGVAPRTGSSSRARWDLSPAEAIRGTARATSLRRRQRTDTDDISAEKEEEEEGKPQQRGGSLMNECQLAYQDEGKHGCYCRAAGIPQWRGSVFPPCTREELSNRHDETPKVSIQ